ncbi:MAG: polysaccharide biosynthesis C-terminal domain-containing protein [Planctomycetota bacterium]|nr:polysaccharide biosynthesis C-terminal domain-containing protein [Planctomycetota bacterium]
MASGVRDFATVFGTKMVLLLTGIASQSIMAWILGPGERGSYAVCLLFSTLLSIVFMVGCDYAAIYYVASKKFSVSEAVIQTFIYGGIGSILAIGAGLAIMQFPLAFLQKAPYSAFYFSLALVPISLFSFTFLEILTALREFGWYGRIAVAVGVLQVALMALLVWAFRFGVVGALAATMSNQALVIVVALLFLRRKHGLTWSRPSLAKMKMMFSYGIRYYIGKIGNNLNFQIGTIILAMFATKEDVGLFDVATLLAARIMMLPDVLMTVLIPRVASDRMGRPELIVQGARVVFVVSAVALGALVLLAEPVISVLFSPAFLPMALVVRLLALGVLARSASKVFVPYLLGTDHPGASSASVIIGMVVNLGVLVVLMPSMGLAGAAVAMTAGYLVGSFILSMSFCRYSGLRYREIWRFQRSDWAPMFDMVRRFRGRLGPETQGY